ncbi:MAG: helix-turn-helix domain-containing protein [Chloroflexota bacterium]
MEPEPLISISEASQMLGVSETALRQWTDEGKLKAFITPGGHRRYARAELKKFMGNQPKTFGIKDLVVELEDSARSLRETSRASLKTGSWYQQLSESSREQLAHLGRQLLDLIIKYVTERSHRGETIQQAHDVGNELGVTLARLGLPLTDSVEVFITHREPVMKAATQLLKKREAYTGRVAEAIPLVTQVMDEALVSLVAAHQRQWSGLHKEPAGDATG